MMFDEFGGSSSAAILEGFQYISSLLDQGVEIIAINHSWGGGSAIVDEASNAFVMEMTALQKTMEAMEQFGVCQLVTLV